MRQNLTAQDQTDTAADAKKLRDYQAKAVNAAAKALNETDRTTVVMACGTGKTITSLRLLEKLVEDDHSPLAIVALPSLGLLSQTLTEWSRDAVRVFSAAAVCSDDEVAHSPEAGEIVVPVTTNSDDLGEWMTTTSGPRVIYTTYQSSPVVARALKERGEAADVLIADEAHRTASRDDATFATLLDDSRAPILRRVYLTATPRVHTSTADDDLLLSMDDVEIYGDRAYTYSFSDAVEDDVLSDYQVAVVALTNEEAKSLSSGTSPAQLQSTAAQAALVRAALDYDVHRAFVYSASVARSEDFAQGLPHVIDAIGGLDRDRVTVDHLDSSTPLSHRRAMLEALAAADEDYVFLSNCRVLGEGVDAPALDAVVFADPKTSSIEIVQTVGRAMRKNPRRDGSALIVLPVIVGDSDDPNEALAESNFKHVWATIRALSDMDPRFDNEIRRADPIVDGSAGAEAAHSLSFVGALGGLRAEMVRALQLRTVEVRDAVSPELGLARLENSAFFREHGHINISYRHEIDGWKAGVWLASLRQKKKQGRLRSEDIEHANALRIIWSIKQHVSDEEALIRLEASEFYKENGHINMPANMTIGDWRAGKWVDGVRQRQRKGDLDKSIQTQAEALNISWSVRKNISEEEALTRLETSDFYREHGHINMPKNHMCGDWRAGIYLVNLRRRYREGKVAKRFVSKFEALGFDWFPARSRDNRRVKEYSVRLDQLGQTDFYRKHGHINVPRNFMIGEWHAGQWVVDVRMKLRRGELPAEIAEQADTLGLRQDIKHTPSPEEGLDLLENSEFFRERGHINVPWNETIDGWRCGSWLVSLRKKRRKGELSEFVVKRANSLGVEWNPARSRADEWLERLENSEFYSKHGHINIPAGTIVDGLNAGQWIQNFRGKFRRGELSREIVERAEKLGIDWSPSRGVSYADGLDRLETSDFYRKYGHINIPTTMVLGVWKAGGWLSKLRGKFRRGELSREVVERAEKLGIDWSPGKGDSGGASEG